MEPVFAELALQHEATVDALADAVLDVTVVARLLHHVLPTQLAHGLHLQHFRPLELRHLP